MFDDGQAEARATGRPRAGGVDAEEPFEDSFLSALGNADPLIAYGTHCVKAVPFNNELDRGSWL